MALATIRFITNSLLYILIDTCVRIRSLSSAAWCVRFAVAGDGASLVDSKACVGEQEGEEDGGELSELHFVGGGGV